MNISIFGLGYVGCVSLGCLAKNGNNLIGVDTSIDKVELINEGKATIIEKDIDQLIENGVEKGRITASSNHHFAVMNSEISIICVGTPSTNNGQLDLKHIFKVSEQIGEVLKNKDVFHTIVIRSTVLPGTNKKVENIIKNKSKKKVKQDFAIISNPEFLREGTAVKDYFNPPLTVIGGDCDKGLEIISKLYSNIKAPIEIVDIEVAEIIKYVNNSFHALKISFANEVGNICKKLNIDSHIVMKIFGMDDKLNISTYYFKPGFAYGGSCLPKDLKAFKTIAHDKYLQSPVIESINSSNENQKTLALNLILETRKQKIGFISISFKAGTDDLRYSASVDLIEKLIGKGKSIMIYDDKVSMSKIIGSNKSFIESKLPHISNLIVNDIDKLINNCDVIVIPNNVEVIDKIKIPDNKIIIDLVRIQKLENHKNYNGLCW